MASELTSIVLEFSEDDLSDTTPTWQDVTNPYLRSIEWWSGVDNEGDEPQPGGAQIVLKNINRDWEPDYAAGRFSPNIVYGRRFRLTLNDGTGATQEGLWYITDIAINYPAGTDYSEVTITCADGFEVLALDDIESLDPPDAESYADVVGFDQPWGYWRLGETQSETQAVSVSRTIVRGKGKNRRKLKRKSRRRETTVTTDGVTGPAGVFKNRVNLLPGQGGLILGDSDTSLKFLDGTSDPYVLLPRSDDDITWSGQTLTLEAWVRVDSGGSGLVMIGGPESGGDSSWSLRVTTASGAEFGIETAGVFALQGGTIVADTTYHVAGVYDQRNGRLYVDGVLVDSGTSDADLPTPDAGSSLLLGAEHGVSVPVGGGVARLDEAALYERALTPERVLAHYQAGAQRGWPEQTAGARIADIATHALWSEASIQTTGRNVQPQMKHGQARLEEISELMQAEGPQTLFFFNGSGDPVYLGYEWKALSSAYNAVQATFGDEAGDIGIEGIEPVYDNETFNVVEASREGGELVSVGAGGTPRRVNPDFTDLLLSDDDDVETIANHVLDLYETPAMRPKTVFVNGAKAVRQILDLKIGHLIRVRRAGIDRVANILGYRKSLGPDRHLTCQYNLARGFNADDGFWHVGISGWSEIGQTTKVA